MADLDLLLEAERRGLLPADKQGLLNEARSRGLIGGGQPPKPEETTSGFTGAFGAGLASLKGETALTGAKIGSMFGVDKLKEAEEYRAKQEQEAKKFKPTEKGWTEAPIEKLKELAGGSAAYMMAPLAAAGATALLPEAAAGAGIAALGMRIGVPAIASFATNTAQFTGSNLARQMDADEGKKLADTSLLKAGATAIPQSLLDTGAMGMVPGVRKILGQAGINIGEKAAEQIAKKGLLSTAGEYGKVIGKTAGVEGVTETGQAFLERLQAGLNLTDPEARKEYYDNFIGGAVLGGAMGGAGHFYEKTFPSKEPAAQSTFEAPPPPTETKAVEPLKLGYNPPVEDVVEKDPLQNPVGNLMPNELTPEIVKFVNDRRKEEGKPKLRSFSIEDLVEAGAPPQEVDRLLAYKNQFDGSVNLAPEDVKNIAQQRNVDTETKGFADFLRRSTGQEDLTQMSQPQLHSAFVALNALETAPELRVLPEGTNAVRFTDKQYDKGLRGLEIALGDSPAIGRASVIQEIKDFTGLENDHDANVLLRTAIRNGDLESTRIPQYEVGKETEDGNFKVHYVSNSKEAATRSADKLGLTVRDGFREEIGFPGESTQLPGGPDIRMGMFKEGDKPEGYEIKAGSKVLSVSNNESEANEKAARLSAVREQEAKTIQTKISELGKKILASQNELERMEATGQGHSLEFAQLSASMNADNQAIVDETNKLKKDLNDYQQPVTVSPTKSVKPIVREGFTFFDNGAAVASFPTQQQAEQFALSRLDDEKLTNIVNVGPTLKGLMPKRLAKLAEAELRGRAEPGIEVKFTGTEEEARERLAKLGIFSGAVQDKVKELEKALLPALRKLGLERVGLNIVRDIENNAEGNYAAGVIKIALDNEPGSHLGVLRHESLHALKELGAFTDKEWAVLNKQAKEKWVPQYMKDRTTEYKGKQVSLYDAYRDIYQKEAGNLKGFDEYIQEEAIAEAFRYFKPQAGTFGNLGYRLAKFFTALKNAFKGLGFQTADSVFEKIEAGKMRPKQEAAIKEAEKFSLRTISSLNTAFNIAKGYNFERNKELKEVLQALVNFRAEKEDIDLKTYSDETKEHLVEVGLADAIRSLKSNASAVGWYDRKVNQALAIVSLIHPEIATDPNAKFAFTWALAVTSNGQKVDQNFELAEKAYKYYKRYGKMPTNIKAGQAQGAINKSLKLFNEMEKDYGLDLLRSFMATEFTASQIEKATGIKVTGEFKDTKVLGAAILGPKIGNGFFSNLNGIFDRLTMDRWLMRTWGRWTGTLVEINQPMIEKKREELKGDVAKLLKDKVATEEISKLLKQEIAPIESDEQADALAIAIQKTSMLPENRKVLNKTDAGESIRKSGNALFKYLDGQKEAPNGPAERDAIRDVFKDILKGLHSQGYQDMTMSDLQALLWYPEKRLYDIAKDSNIEEDYTTEEAPDYANAAAKLARSKKVSNEKIQAEIKKVDEDYDNRAAAAKRGTGNGTSQPSAQGRVAPLNRKEYKRFLTRGILQSYRERNEKASGPYVRDSGKDGKGIRVLEVVAKAKYNPKTAFKNVMQEAGASVPALYELQAQDADIFQDAIQASKDKNDFGAAVTVYPESEYAKMRLFIAEDGKAGFALKGDDIVSVFAEAPHVGASAPMLQLAVQEGGRKLDAFDTVLPDLYFNAGFKIVSRTEFNEEYQPDGWSKQTFKQFNNGKPDVVFMVFDPNNTEVPSPTAGRLYEDYDEAVKAQDAATKDYKFPVKPTTEEKVYKKEVKYSLRAQQKDVSKSRIGDESKVRFERTKELQEAVQKVARGEITRDEYNRLVDTLRPVMPYEEVPEPATKEEALEALTSNKKPMFGIANKVLKAKQYVQLRLDIPAYENHDTWIVSIHEPKSLDLETAAAFKAGPAVAYDSVARITNAHFGMDENTAFNIARGFFESKGEQKKMHKATIATILGQWKPTTPAEAKSLADDALHSKDWIQVGMDPFRHGYFYNRDTMEPIWSADEVIQIGPLVLAKNAKVYTQEQEAGIKYSLRATKTPEFKQWFGKSKIVDEDGEPKVMYHGTARDITAFRPKQANAIFVTDNPDFASVFSGMSEGYMLKEFVNKMTNEDKKDFLLKVLKENKKQFDKEDYNFILESINTSQNLYTSTNLLSEVGYIDKKFYIDVRKEIGRNLGSGQNIMPLYVRSENPFDYENPEHVKKLIEKIKTKDKAFVRNRTQDLEDGDWATIEHPIAQKAIKDLGHDGFYVFEANEKNLAVYEPSQIKSATGNIGTFDINNPDIRYSIRANLPPATNARIDATTGQRKTEGFMDRILSILNPETRAKLRAGFVFQFEALERNTKARAAKYGNNEYMADVSATAAALESMRAKQIVAAAMRDGVPVYRNGFTTTDNLNGTQKGLLDIFSPLAATGDPDVWRCFQFYAGSKRGARLDAEGREHLFTPADVQAANAMVAQFKQDGIDFDAVYKEYQKWNDALVKYMKDTGVLSAADAAYFTKFGDYIPFYRQVDGESTVGPKIFSSIAGVQKPKALKGAGTYAVYDANGNKVGSYKNQNDANNRAAQIKGTVKVEGIPLGDFLENVIRNASAAVESGMKNVAANRGIRDALDLGTARQVNVQNQDTVSVKENGVTKFYELDDPLLFEAFKGLNVPRMPWLQVLAKPADILRNFVTKDPGFILANIMRDSVSAWVTSGSDMKPVIDSFKQFGKILAGQSPEAVAMAKAGLGGYEFKGSLKDSADAFEKALRAKTGTRTKTEKALLPFTALWDMLEQGSNASDMATRAEIYKRVLAETNNEAEALFQASEVMNFSRKGNFAVMQAITAVVPFMNARIQGLDVLYRSGFGQAANANKERMQKAFIVRSMAILGMTMAYWAMVHDDDEYKKLTKEERDGYWIVPGLTFNGKPFRFPIPFELGVVFKVFPERILEYTMGQDTEKDFRESITRNIVDTLKFNPIPQAFIPIYENISNHSFFTGEKIVGRGLEDVAKPLQYTASTSLFSRELGEATGMSPIQIDNVIRGYTGTMGMYAVNMLDSFFSTQDAPVKATTRAEQLPVIKRFFASDSGTVAQYYDLKDEVDEVVRTVNFLSERDPDRLEKYMTESNINLYGMRSYVSTIERHMKQIRSYRTAVNSDPAIGADEKRKILDELHDAEVDLTKDIKAIRKEFH